MNDNDPEYPYWIDDFKKYYKGYTLFFREKDWPKNIDDIADSYRVFMILCNNKEPNESRLDIVKKIINATEENPINYRDEEFFWSEKD